MRFGAAGFGPQEIENWRQLASEGDMPQLRYYPRCFPAYTEPRSSNLSTSNRLTRGTSHAAETEPCVLSTAKGTEAAARKGEFT
jgi:hypothetical protein